jgi:prephenate dehydrogenase
MDCHSDAVMSARAGSIAIFGPGLMGGSLLMALRKHRPSAHLAAWARRPQALEALRNRHLADTVSTNATEVARGADVIVLCVPVDHMAALAADIAPAVASHTLVTDVGSVKAPVVSKLEAFFKDGSNFVGSHPMCGSEDAGLDAAREDLYEGAPCIVTPTPVSQPDRISGATELWRSVGGNVLEMDPATHDRAAAFASHVPHVAAAALVEAVCTQDPAFRALCAGGFRDTTRVASGSPGLWTAILSQNRVETVHALTALTAVLEDFRLALEKNDTDSLSRLLASAATHRAEIMPAP